MHLGGWLMCLACTALAAVDAAPTAATPSSRLDEQGFWKAWLLFEDPAVQHSEETGRRKGQIMPKSIFIAPVVKGQLPDCAPGYQADALGRCNKLVKVNQNAQLGFLLQKLNAMYANPDRLVAPKRPTTTEGPLQLSIPLDGMVLPAVATTLSTTTTPAPTTSEEPTEVAEMMVVAAQVELEDDSKSTSLPGAIVTLWHVNETAQATTTLLPEATETETVAPTEMTTLPADLEETSASTIEAETPTTVLPEEGDDGTTLVTTTSPLEEEESLATTTPKTPFRRPAMPDPPVRVISKPAEPDQLAIIEAEYYLEEDGTQIPESQPEEQKSPVILDRPYPLSFERPSTQGEVLLADLSVDNSSPNAQWGQPAEKAETKPPVPSTPDRIVFPDEQLRSGGVPSTTPWAWGSWSRQTTPRPLLLNFYSHVPSLSHNSGVRTHLSHHSSIFPTPGRRTPLFYQELTGRDVANVLGRPWRHIRNQY